MPITSTVHDKHPTMLVPAPPFDPALPALTLGLHPEFARQVFQSWLDRSGLTVAACRPVYIRYKPGTNATVRYDLELSDEHHTWHEIVVLRVLPPGRSERQIAKSWIVAATETYRRLDRVPPIVDPVVVLPELDALAVSFPIDAKLPGLPEVLSGRSWARPSVVRYKPGRKALLRSITSAGGNTAELYTKVFEPALATMLEHRARSCAAALQANGISAAAPLGCSPDLGAVFYAGVPGTPLLELRKTPGYLDYLPTVIETARALRSSALFPLSPHRLADESSMLHASANTLKWLIPALQAELDELVSTLDALLGQLSDDLLPAHGDYYDDQILVDPTRTTVIDFDEARLAHPILDPGNFVAHIEAAIECGATEPGVDWLIAARDQLTEAWETELGSAALATATACGLLKLAVGPFRRLELNWPARIQALITLARRAIPEQRRSRPSPQLDPGLPDLPAALDPALVGRMVGLQLGRPELVKHKVGRRAVARYQVVSPGRTHPPIFVKVFADERGLRSAEKTEAVRAALTGRVMIPRVLHIEEHGRVVILEGLAGDPLDVLLRTDDRAAGRAGLALATLHGSSAQLEYRHTPDNELRATARQLAALRDTDSALDRAAQEIFQTIAQTLRALDPWRFLPAHRDCHPAQILVSAEAVGMIDLDEACLTEPAVDVGNVLAHYDLEALLHPDDTPLIRRAADDFWAAYRLGFPSVGDRQVATLRTVALLRLVGVHTPRLGSEFGFAILAASQEQFAVATFKSRGG